jgi:hypothetical protein
VNESITLQNPNQPKITLKLERGAECTLELYEPREGVPWLITTQSPIRGLPVELLRRRVGDGTIDLENIVVLGEYFPCL